MLKEPMLKEPILKEPILLPFFDLRVLGIFEAEELIDQEPNKWNVISLSSKVWDHPRGEWVKESPNLEKCKNLIKCNFDDIDRPYKDLTLCKERDIINCIEFAEKCIGDSLLVHCHAGQRRSPTMAILIILNNIKDKSDTPMLDACKHIFKIRDIARINQHILNLGISLIARNSEEEKAWFIESAMLR